MRGFTLIETLVALVVLSLGLLGIAALYLDGLKNGRSALYRAQAVNLATEMAERIRANRAALVEEELSRWLVAIHDTLPGNGTDTPGGTIAIDSATRPATYTITVTWSEPGADLPMSYVLRISA